MIGFNTDSIMDTINKRAAEQVTRMANNIKQHLIYDAMVENIDISKINMSLNKDSNNQYTISFDMSELNDYYKQLVRDVYYNNALKRRT